MQSMRTLGGSMFVSSVLSVTTVAVGAVVGVAVGAVVGTAHATDVLATSFDDYAIGNLSGQIGFLGPAGSWATSGATNSPFVAASVIGVGTAPGVDPVRRHRQDGASLHRTLQRGTFEGLA